MNEVLIKGAHGGRIDVSAGQILDVINVEGEQICDFFAFNTDDLEETLSPGHIRSNLGRIWLEVGDILVSCLRNPMFEILEDTCGQNDILFPPCDPAVYVLRFGLHDHRSCHTNLQEVTTDLGVPYSYLPHPVNFFQNTPVEADGTLGRKPSPAKPGDKISLKVLMNMIVAGSACPMEGGINGDAPTDIRFVVRDA